MDWIVDLSCSLVACVSLAMILAPEPAQESAADQAAEVEALVAGLAENLKMGPAEAWAQRSHGA
jgi:hypothetical protein